MANTFLQQFPKLYPIDINRHEEGFEGYIEISGCDYFVSIKTPYFPNAKNLSVDAEIPSTETIHNEILTGGNLEAISVENYLQIFQQKCKSLSQFSNYDDIFSNSDDSTYSLALSDIEQLGWENVSHISSDFSTLNLETRDGKDRVHKLIVKITAKYPIQPPDVEADLPIEFTFKWNLNIKDIFNSWKKCLFDLQPFWDVMDCLDEKAFVIDPLLPTRRHITRRIILENKVSAQLTISPKHPFEPPKCTFLGPSSLVAPLDDQFVKNYQIWNPSENIVSNLESILGIKIIRKSYGPLEDSEWELKCAVCYSLHLDEQLPDFNCDYCQKHFHYLCLYDWLRSLPGSRQTAQFISGDCPYCTKVISCQLPS